MERDKPTIGRTKGGGAKDKNNGDVKEEVNEISNEETREWTR